MARAASGSRRHHRMPSAKAAGASAISRCRPCVRLLAGDHDAAVPGCGRGQGLGRLPPAQDEARPGQARAQARQHLPDQREAGLDGGSVAEAPGVEDHRCGPGGEGGRPVGGGPGERLAVDRVRHDPDLAAQLPVDAGEQQRVVLAAGPDLVRRGHEARLAVDDALPEPRLGRRVAQPLPQRVEVAPQHLLDVVRIVDQPAPGLSKGRQGGHELGGLHHDEIRLRRVDDRTDPHPHLLEPRLAQPRAHGVLAARPQEPGPAIGKGPRRAQIDPAHGRRVGRNGGHVVVPGPQAQQGNRPQRTQRLDALPVAQLLAADGGVGHAVEDDERSGHARRHRKVDDAHS